MSGAEQGRFGALEFFAGDELFLIELGQMGQFAQPLGFRVLRAGPERRGGDLRSRCGRGRPNLTDASPPRKLIRDCRPEGTETPCSPRIKVTAWALQFAVNEVAPSAVSASPTRKIQPQ